MHTGSRMQNCLLGLNAKLSCNNLRHPKTADRLSSWDEHRLCTIIRERTNEQCLGKTFGIVSGNKPFNSIRCLIATLKTSACHQIKHCVCRCCLLKPAGCRLKDTRAEYLVITTARQMSDLQLVPVEQCKQC